MFRKDKSKVTKPTPKITSDYLKNKENRVDFKVSPFTPYGRLGSWFQLIWRF